ncbi:hypothetical protein Pmani_027015 [Petrolisthes manimaculis]|uniref:Uncharacterized protein n=1 Tax=Petrolisthes manimaculis TaxID=1843537 RepID=A0AAE1TW59_9EUCA|nr:hypothetical protein Pmani_027015 [Petrolisthes manimaculis]
MECNRGVVTSSTHLLQSTTTHPPSSTYLLHLHHYPSTQLHIPSPPPPLPIHPAPHTFSSPPPPIHPAPHTFSTPTTTHPPSSIHLLHPYISTVQLHLLLPLLKSECRKILYLF